MTQNTHLFHLRRLQSGDEQAFLAAYREFEQSKDFSFVSHFREGMDFRHLLKILADQEQGIHLCEGHVPSTFLFAFVGTKIVGRVMIRHALNACLKRIGGHLGYGVVPSERRKGYGTKMCKEALVIARLMGLSQVLVTCDEHNIASRKIIKHAGGELQSVSDPENAAPRKRLYWIEPKIHRVVIVGASGSGKTTLGKQLANKWQLPFCDLDDLAWLPGWKNRNLQEERAELEQVVDQDKWIVVGNYSRHQDITWRQADLMIWLDPSLATCLWRGLRRSVQNIWYQRPLCNGNYDHWSRLLRFDNRSILYWILTTHGKRRARYEKILEKEKDVTLPVHLRIRNNRLLSKLGFHEKNAHFLRRFFEKF